MFYSTLCVTSAFTSLAATQAAAIFMGFSGGTCLKLEGKCAQTKEHTTLKTMRLAISLFFFFTANASMKNAYWMATKARISLTLPKGYSIRWLQVAAFIPTYITAFIRCAPDGIMEFPKWRILSCLLSVDTASTFDAASTLLYYL